MWMDIVDLQNFYASELGQTAGQHIRRHIRLLWSNVQGLRVLSLGYAEPYLDLFAGEAQCVLAGMPARQGAFILPKAKCDQPVGAPFLTDEAALPLPDRSIDRLLLIHCLEASDMTNAMLREIWRVLTDGGRLMVVVPNRRSLWAQMERTPFGNGSPFSPGQLQRLLHGNMFTVEHTASTLFLPPIGQGGLLRTCGAALDTPGSRWLPSLGGVLLTDATKQIYAATPSSVGSRRRTYLPIPHNYRPPE